VVSYPGSWSRGTRGLPREEGGKIARSSAGRIEKGFLTSLVLGVEIQDVSEVEWGKDSKVQHKEGWEGWVSLPWTPLEKGGKNDRPAQGRMR